MSSSATVYAEQQLRELTSSGWNVLQDNTVHDVTSSDAADAMYDGYCGPSADVLAHADNALDMFLYFLPKSFWRHTASESNRYEMQSRDDRVEAILKLNEDLIAREINERGSAKRKKKTRELVTRKLEKFTKIKPHELVVWIGLLVARVLSPMKTLRAHWTTTKKGAMPLGMFGDFMSRDRFEEVSRFLHFSDNQGQGASLDRAWKIRPILNTLEQTFKQGYVLGSRIALDEGMLPNRNKMNPTRTFMKDKPHKWGSKCVLTCCALSGYCKRYVFLYDLFQILMVF